MLRKVLSFFRSTPPGEYDDVFKVSKDGQKITSEYFPSLSEYIESASDSIKITFSSLYTSKKFFDPLPRPPVLNPDNLCLSYKRFSLSLPVYGQRTIDLDGISLNGSMCPWDSLTFEAKCEDIFKGTYKDEVSNHLLSRTCSCGIYSYFSLNDLQANYPVSSLGWCNVIGEIVNWGVVLPHSFGVRSEFAKITRLWIVSDNYLAAKAQEGIIKLRYGNEVPISIVSFVEYLKMANNVF